MIRGLLLLGLAAASAGTALETDRPHDRFQHDVHRKALAREGLDCTACHAVGAAPGADLAPPEGVCHSCHVDREGRALRAPATCATCHDRVAAPEGHGPGWLDAHGPASRTERCDSCHRGSECVDCHERREPVRFAVHDRSFLAVHGIAVRTDPAGCGSCHVEAFCVACHSREAR
ncbi:MAG: cytochrome c3 family protein [Myxococcota bacterium]